MTECHVCGRRERSAARLHRRRRRDGQRRHRHDARRAHQQRHPSSSTRCSRRPTRPTTSRTASCTGNHASLVSAVVQAGLLETLQGDGPFTVFAPTDQAFTDAGIDLAALDTPKARAPVRHPAVPRRRGERACGQRDRLHVGDDRQRPPASHRGRCDGERRHRDRHGRAHQQRHHPCHRQGADAHRDPNDIPRTARCTGAHDSLGRGDQAELLPPCRTTAFTVFAPTDQAFADAGIDLAALDTPEGKATLADILLYVVGASVLRPTSRNA